MLLDNFFLVFFSWFWALAFSKLLMDESCSDGLLFTVTECTVFIFRCCLPPSTQCPQLLSILTTYLFGRVWEAQRKRASVTKYKCFKCVLDKNWEDGLRRFTGCWLFMLFVCNSNAKCLVLCQNKNDIYIFTGFRFTKFELDRYLSLFIQSSNYSNLSRGSQRRRLFLEIFSSRELSEKKVLCFIYCLQRNFNWIQMA